MMASVADGISFFWPFLSLRKQLRPRLPKPASSLIKSECCFWSDQMPIFEYKCESCGTKFEKLLRRSEERDSLACPACSATSLKQEFSTFSARANGSPSASADFPSCPGGMCRTPDLCGRN